MIKTGWAMTTLGDVTTAPRPRRLPRELPSLPFIGMEQVEAHTMRLLGTVPASSVKSAAVHFQPEDVLYGRLRPYLNKVLHPTFEGLCSAEFIVLVASEAIDTRFLQHLLNSAAFLRFASQLDTGDRPRVSLDQIADYNVALPPMAEQRRIVAAIEEHLSRLDAALAGLKRVQAQLPTYWTAVLKAAVEGRLVPCSADGTNGAAWLREFGDPQAELSATTGPWTLPPAWSWVRLDGVGDVQLGRQRAPQYATGRFARPYLRVANISEDHVDLSDLKEMDFQERDFHRYRLEPGDIMLSEGQSPELVGESAVYQGGVPGLCYQKTLHRFRAKPGAPSPRYCQSVFRAFRRLGVFRKASSITTNIAHLTLERLKPLPFPLPPRKEAEAIAAEVDRLLSNAGRLDALATAALGRATALRRSVLARAFSGALVLQDPNDEPAAALLERIRAARAASPDGARRRPSRRAQKASQTAAPPEQGTS